MPSSIEGGRWDTWLRRKFSIKSDAIAPELSDFVQPVISIPGGLEDEFLISTKAVFGNASAPAVAGRFSRIILTNPADSGHLVIVEGFTCAVLSGVLNIHHHRNLTVGVTGSASVRIRDTRWGEPVLSPVTASFLQGDVAPGLTNPAWALTATNMLNLWYPMPVVLASPDNNSSHFVMESTTVNSSLNCSLMWREVIVEPSWFA